MERGNQMYYPCQIIWLDNERQRLFNSYGKLDKEKLFLLFPDRTWQALKTKASRLRIPRSNRWFTEKEDFLLIYLKKQGLSYKEMICYFEFRTENSLKNRYWRIKHKN